MSLYHKWWQNHIRKLVIDKSDDVKYFDENGSLNNDVKDSIIDNILHPLTFYHTSSIKYPNNKITPKAPCFGTRLYDADWVVYMWKSKEYAYYYTIARTVTDIVNRLVKADFSNGKLIKCKSSINDKVVYMDAATAKILKPMCIGEVLYIYKIKVPISGVTKLRLGHTNDFPEYALADTATIDGKETIVIDEKLFDKYVKIVSDPKAVKSKKGIKITDFIYLPKEEYQAKSVLMGNLKAKPKYADGKVDLAKELSGTGVYDITAKYQSFKLIKKYILDKLSKKEYKMLVSSEHPTYIDSPNMVMRSVYIQDNKFAGFIELSDMDNNGNLAISIVVLDKYRGKRYSIAQKLMSHAVQFCKDSKGKYNKLVYLVYKTNARGVAFAKKMHFKLESIDKRDYIYTMDV